MTQVRVHRQPLSRRSLLAGSASLAGAAALSTSAVRAQQNANLGTPATVISNPPRQWDPHNPSIYPDPDVIALDPRFDRRERIGEDAALADAASAQRRFTPALIASGKVPRRRRVTREIEQHESVSFVRA